MKRLWSLPLLMICSLAAAGHLRSDQWREDLYFVGESFSPKPIVRNNLGVPDVEEHTKTAGGDYAPFQPLICAKLPEGIALTAWHYQDSEQHITYLFYFKGDQMMCMTFIFGENSRNEPNNSVKPNPLPGSA